MLSGKIRGFGRRARVPTKSESLKVSRSLTERVLRKCGIHSVHKKLKLTTDSNHSYPVSENVLNRNFLADRIAQKWVSDLTYTHQRRLAVCNCYY